MNREIKFRAYIKTLEWIVPVSRINFDCETVEVDLTDGNGDFTEYDFDEIIIMQYTGLKDKKGVEIYEGDIVTMPSYRGGKWKTNVYYKNGKFAVNGSNYHFKDISTRGMKVIGDIHTNPELLEVQTDEY